MGKKKSGKYTKKDTTIPKKPAIQFDADDEDMANDEIDAFHKQRDIVSLDVNKDMSDSDEDEDLPVFDVEDEEEDEEEDDDDDDMEDNDPLIAKITKQKKLLKEKMGGAEDEVEDDAEEDEPKNTVWSTNKGLYYNADNTDFEIQTDDDEAPAEEEAEVLRLMTEKAKTLSREDFGLEDTSEDESDSDKEPTIEETLAHGKSASKVTVDKGAKNETGTIYEEVKKDLNALTREEQMDVVYSSAPELVGLLSELNDAYDQLENKVNPLLSKIGEVKDGIKGGMHYLKVKQMLLLSYCQAITFYLLFKAEGRSARDHPVISRLVELRTLLDKMKELDGNLPDELEDIINKNVNVEEQVNMVEEDTDSDSVVSAENNDMTEVDEVTEKLEMNSSKDHKEIGLKRKHRDSEVSVQSKEMLKIRAALEEKLKKNGVFTSLAQKNDKRKKHQQPLNGQLETRDDFDDDAIGGDSKGRSSKISQLTSQAKKPKLISGDDDLPKRDDIGERRRKHEMRVLSRAGIEPQDEAQDEDEAQSDGDSEESDFEVYKQVEQERAAKIASKEKLYSRPSKVSFVPELEVEGKRHISYQMEKNRGLTRSRKKLIKNPRKKYRLQHEKKVIKRKGQVRDIRKQDGSYGGETSGINTYTSRSIRFNN